MGCEFEGVVGDLDFEVGCECGGILVWLRGLVLNSLSGFGYVMSGRKWCKEYGIFLWMGGLVLVCGLEGNGKYWVFN